MILPVVHGNYGNVFAPEAPDLTSDDGACWLDIEGVDGSTVGTALAAHRHHPDSVNQFHVNVHADVQPPKAELRCFLNQEEYLLDGRTFDPTLPELPPVAIVGEEQGIQQLQQREILEIEQALQHISASDAATIPADALMKIKGMTSAELESQLSDSSWNVIRAYLQNEAEAEKV